MMRFSGKIAVVTGAAVGLGHPISGQFAAEGDVVVAADVMAEGARETASAIVAAGERALAVQADVWPWTDVQRHDRRGC
jgi:NAD(P)-dependent dehydrogenase (short-subunit alcohol dehydrogenase family)